MPARPACLAAVLVALLALLVSPGRARAPIPLKAGMGWAWAIPENEAM